MTKWPTWLLTALIGSGLVIAIGLVVALFVFLVSYKNGLLLLIGVIGLVVFVLFKISHSIVVEVIKR